MAVRSILVILLVLVQNDAVQILRGAAQGNETELHLSFQDETGSPVKISKSELLLVAESRVDRIELQAGQPSLVLSMDEKWLRSRWANWFDKQIGVYIYLQAEGYASIRSNLLIWPGSHGGILNALHERVSTLRLSFPNSKSVTLEEGRRATVAVVFRRPSNRYLRIVDEHGHPLGGVKVSSYMYWSDYNPCKALAGADLLGRTMTGDDGRVQIPDGEFEYAIEFAKAYYYPIEAGGYVHITPDVPRLIIYLRKLETTIAMHRLQSRSIAIKVTMHGKPVEGLILAGRLAGCPCGACSGSVSESDAPGLRTDAKGMLQIPVFYPER